MVLVEQETGREGRKERRKGGREEETEDKGGRPKQVTPGISYAHAGVGRTRRTGQQQTIVGLFLGGC